MGKKLSIENTIGRVIFECGCTIQLKDIKKSKIKGSYRCLYHKVCIKNIIKNCLNCKTNKIDFREISQILKQNFCCKECAISYRKEQAKLIDINPPEKFVNCAHYEYCYNIASLSNSANFSCNGCEFYMIKNLSNTSNREEIWKIL